MADKINQEVLDQLLVEVTSEIAEYLRKDEADLRKAVGEEDESAPSEESEGSEGPAAPEASAAPPGGEESAPAEAPPAEGSPQMDEASAAPEGSAPHEGGEIEPAPTVEGLQSEYMKLDPEALKMHYLACKSALMAQMGAGPEASAAPAPEASAPAASAPAAPPAAPEASAPMAMGELKSSGKQLEASAEANGGEISAGSKLGKSETAQIAELKAQLAKTEALNKSQEEQLLELAMKLTAPLRKSIRNVSELAYVAKEGSTEKKSPVEGLSKNEIVAKLRDKARSDLKKSDRELITAYTMGNVDVSKIEHLLVEQAK